MNTDRKAILRYLEPLAPGTTISTHWVAVGCAIGYDDAERELLALDVLGLAEFSGAGWALGGTRVAPAPRLLPAAKPHKYPLASKPTDA